MPQQGTLKIKTEFGRMVVKPNEICVIQQGYFHLKINFEINLVLNNDFQKGCDSALKLTAHPAATFSRFTTLISYSLIWDPSVYN